MDDANELMKRFETFLNELDSRIAIGSRYEELQGIGTEYLVKDGTVIAKFFKGKLISGIPLGNSELTAA